MAKNKKTEIKFTQEEVGSLQQLRTNYASIESMFGKLEVARLQLEKQAENPVIDSEPDYKHMFIELIKQNSDFKSLIIEKDFEPENPKQLEELDENSCKWPIGHPNEKSFYFCGRSSLKDFSYCKLHLLYAYQPKGKKEDVSDKEDVPDFIEKKIQSA